MADGRVVIEAILDATNVTKNVKKLNQDIKGITWKDLSKGTDKAKELSTSFKDAGTACTAKLTAPVAAAGAAAFKVASDYDSATSRIQAAFGVTREEAERFKDIGATIYEGGWGESLDDVTNALIQTKSTIRDIDDQGLQKVTQNALVLADTFDADVNESIRGTNALMEGFGLSADEATDLLAAGMQHGLNYTDELADNLSEYSVRWGQAGVSASEYFSLLEAGASNGAYNLDKVGDFLNEFLTSLSDGRLEENIGKFSDGTKKVFENFKSGKATAKDVLDAVIGDMQNMTNETDRAALAGSLWSSLGEDNAMGMILAMGNVENKYSDVADAADNMANAAGDNFASKMESASRTVMGALEPMGEPIENIATKLAEAISAFGNWFASIGEGGQMAVMVIGGVVAAIGPVLGAIGSLITILPQIGPALNVVKGGFDLLKGAFTAFSGPVGIIITVIGALVAAFLYLWNTNEGFRNFWIGLWDSICAVVGGVVEWLNTNVIQPIITGFQGMGDFINMLWQQLVSIVSVAIETISTVITTVITTISTIWNTIWTAISTVASTVWNAIYTAISTYISYAYNTISTIINAIRSVISTVFNAIKSVVSTVWNAISSVIGGAISTAYNIVSNIVNSISNTVSNVFNAIKSVVTSVWNGIKSAIETPMNAARDIVKGIIDAIKGFFNFKISWPHIPMPHFKINPSGWQIGDLLHGSIPSLGIDWYAKGGIFNRPTIAGIGEAGPEGVIPLSGRVMRPFARTIAEEMPEGKSSNTVTNNYYFGDILIKAEDLAGIKTIQEFIELIIRSKRAYA